MTTTIGNFREVAFIVFENGISFTNWGTAGSVEFPDLCDIWDTYSKLGFKKYSFCMIHTHPLGFNCPSERDIKTMKAWKMALGYLPNFYILYDPVNYIRVQFLEDAQPHLTSRNTEKITTIGNTKLWIENGGSMFGGMYMYGMSFSKEKLTKGSKIKRVSLLRSKK